MQGLLPQVCCLRSKSLFDSRLAHERTALDHTLRWKTHLARPGQHSKELHALPAVAAAEAA